MHINMVDDKDMYTMTTRNLDSVQKLLRYIIFHNFSYFSYFSFPNSFMMLYSQESILLSITNLSIYIFVNLLGNSFLQTN